MSKKNRPFFNCLILSHILFLFLSGIVFEVVASDFPNAENGNAVKADKTIISSLPMRQVSGAAASARSLELESKGDMVIALNYENGIRVDQNDSNLNAEGLGPNIEPGAMVVFGAGLIGLIGIIRWRLYDFFR